MARSQPSQKGIGDHGFLAGLPDDDHSQYHNDARGDVRYFQKTEFLNVSTGPTDAGKPVVLDVGGAIDASMINDSDIDHGLIGGLADDDHTQYILVDGTRAFSGNQSFGSNNITNVADISLSSISSAAGTSINITLGTDAGDDLIIGNNNALVVTGDDDRTGFGNINPQAKIHVATDGIFGTGLNVGDQINAPVAGGLRFARAGAAEPFLLFENAGGANTLSQVRGIDGGGLRITDGSGTTEWMRVTTAGLFGFNESSPSATVEIGSVAAATTVFQLKGFVGQSEGYMLVRNSSDTILFQLEADASLLVTNKIKLTQTDGNEFIDSITDGELDWAATTSINQRINGTEKLQLFSGSLSPAINNDLDIGKTDFRFKNAFFSGLICHSTENNIVASTTQTQGQRPLTEEFNNITTVANDGDVATLPPADQGLAVVVLNNGANDMGVFPANGDQIDGAGINVVVDQIADAKAIYYAFDSTNWFKMEV